MKKKTKRAQRFVVGYPMAPNTTIWGQRHFLSPDHKAYQIEDFCRSMTRAEANKAVKKMSSPSAVIYELVPVE